MEPTPRFAIHAHVFYPELWPELAACIRNFGDYDIDLFVTTPHHDTALKTTILGDFPTANYRILENRGYDVGPFCEILNGLDLTHYDFIVKLHTKRDWRGWFNFHYVRGNSWRKRLLSFCATHEALRKTLLIFESNPNTGIVADPSVIVTHGDYLESSTVKNSALNLIKQQGLTTRRRAFIGGTMFIIKAALLKPLQGVCHLQDFEPVRNHELRTLAHVCERVFGYLVSAQGYMIRPSRAGISPIELLWFVIVPTYKILAFLRNQMPDRRVRSDGLR